MNLVCSRTYREWVGTGQRERERERERETETETDRDRDRQRQRDRETERERESVPNCKPYLSNVGGLQFEHICAPSLKLVGTRL